MELVFGPGEDRLKYHDELHCYAEVVLTLSTCQLVLGGIQDQVRTGKEGV